MLNDIEQLVYQSLAWSLTNGEYRAYSSAGVGTEVSREHLDALDPRLAPFIRTLICNGNRPTLPNHIGDCIALTYQYWHGSLETLKVPDMHGVVRDVVIVQEIRSLPNNQDFVVFEAQTLLKKQFESDIYQGASGQSYVIGTGHTDFFVRCSWMDDAYPGWQVRMLSTQALGMRLREQVDFILSKEDHIPSADVSAISFE